MTGRNYAVCAPPGSVRADISVPGDKSIAQRALILGAVAEGKSVIRDLPSSGDCASALRCICDLGIKIEESDNATVIYGKGMYGLRAPSAPLNCGNSGTLMRLLSGILCAQDFSSVLTGDESLLKRPMERIITPLRLMGADVAGREGCAPLEIKGNKMRGIDYSLPVASAQLKSCLLLAGLYASGETTVREPAETRDHTERMLESFGVNTGRSGGAITVKGGRVLKAAEINIPGDFSSAAFFLAAGAILPGAEITVRNAGINPTRTGFLTILEKMGAFIRISNRRDCENEPVGDITVSCEGLRAVSIGEGFVPGLIDELPLLAVLACFAEGVTVLSGAGELRKKESDRIHGIVAGLSRMGAEISETPDGMVIKGGKKLRGAEIEPFGDHRIAMALAVAALGSSGETIIRNADCAAISFPGFFGIIESLSRRV